MVSWSGFWGWSEKRCLWIAFSVDFNLRVCQRDDLSRKRSSSRAPARSNRFLVYVGHVFIFLGEWPSLNSSGDVHQDLVPLHIKLPKERQLSARGKNWEKSDKLLHLILTLHWARTRDFLSYFFGGSSDGTHASEACISGIAVVVPAWRHKSQPQRNKINKHICFRGGFTHAVMLCSALPKTSLFSGVAMHCSDADCAENSFSFFSFNQGQGLSGFFVEELWIEMKCNFFAITCETFSIRMSIAPNDFEVWSFCVHDIGYGLVSFNIVRSLFNTSISLKPRSKNRNVLINLSGCRLSKNKPRRSPHSTKVLDKSKSLRFALLRANR